MNKPNINKKAGKVQILPRPAIKVKRPLESNLGDYSRSSLQITPFSQKIACLWADNAGICVKQQLPGDISKTAHVLGVRKHEGYCVYDVHSNYIGFPLGCVPITRKSRLTATKAGSGRAFTRWRNHFLKWGVSFRLVPSNQALRGK